MTADRHSEAVDTIQRTVRAPGWCLAASRWECSPWPRVHRGPLDLCGIGIPVAGFGIWQMLGEMGEGRGAMAVMVGLGVSSLV